MKNAIKQLGIIALVAIIGFSMTACGGGDDGGGGGGGTGGGGTGGGGSGNETIAVIGVSLDKTFISIPVESTETLTATIEPENATNKAVTWSSSNESIATVSNGTVTAVAEGRATITVTTADSSRTATCAITVTYKFEYDIGDTGPGGGKIFYRSAEGFTVQMENTAENYTAHYLEAAPADMSDKLAWASQEFSKTRIYAYNEAIGYGRKNTAMILATDANAPAAKSCKEYSNNGKTDWFLPSREELKELYKKRTYFDNLKTEDNSYYYYSTEYAGTNDRAESIDFGDGLTNTDYKTYKFFVRAIRAF